MEVYTKNEHIISSDEYSDEDDVLMNDAIASQDQNRNSNYNDQIMQPKYRIDQKQKELSSLIRRNKISIIYKKKAVKWLNNKWQRERYKERQRIPNIENDNILINSTNIAALEPQTQISSNKSGFYKNVQESNDDLISFKTTNKKYFDGKSNINNVSPTSSHVTNSDQESGIRESDEKTTILDNNSNDIAKCKTFADKAGIISEKISKICSPTILNESTESDAIHNHKKFRAESSDFYKSINNMFPKFDKITTNQIDTIANVLTVVEDQLNKLSNEINTLNDVLQTKEMEWKRLSHLKMVKEEIYSRLKKKKYTLQLKESFSNQQHQNILLELKELEAYLSENKEAAEFNNSTTIKKLIENRANMSADDLKREKNNTSRLHSLLVSQNMLHAAESSEKFDATSNGEKIDMGLSRKKDGVYNQLKGETTNRIAQVYNTDVESLILDFRQNNIKLLPLIAKHKPKESTAQCLGFSVPQCEKISRLPLFVKDNHSEFHSLPNSIDEISITPIGCSKKISASNEFANMSSLYDPHLENTFMRQVQKDLNSKCSKNFKNPPCQECSIIESRFVCAGCGNQWYCSKKCQIAAWDKHSELCTV